MRQAVVFLRIGVVFLGIFSLPGCPAHIVANRDEANLTRRVCETKILLFAMEAYKDKHGVLPSSLSGLRNGAPDLNDIDLAQYHYTKEGFAVGDGTVWILSAANPYRKGQWKGELIVGKLPVEVASKAAGLKKLPSRNHNTDDGTIKGSPITAAESSR